ncbi:N-acetylglucosamine kinase-like BadF-type ATPase [Hamadaea flava]|uniref:BadF/BadG/BcrA/BcrD ATPase family protein n=1 Tax=Hamadaea flava TaxID=1742688 RepID=A0ABV8LXG1_9ACTN|nr:BadF/BadG/BcrA/BcrD ATPase family protein [Hamadaea flava]MCP2329139.1 N-acetylglucosamine kinase-like BadF-type ATPase [Hamadaea flava]
MIVGVDVGGTKTHIRSSSGVDVVLPSTGWSALDGASWLLERLPAGVTALAVGAHGAEDRAQCAALRDALAAALDVPVTVVNDGELLLPAAGLRSGVAVVVGTGSIALHDDGSGGVHRAGGWGWILGDDGSASALVRDAARAVLTADDQGQPPSQLADVLTQSFGVATILDLAYALGSDTETWGRHCPAVMSAFAAGCPLAESVVTGGASSLGTLVATFSARGLAFDDVVLGGGLVTAVPAYWALIQSAVSAAVPSARVRLLTAPPVAGALSLAHSLARSAR